VTIDDAIHGAFEKNLNLLAERFNISAADARIVQARFGTECDKQIKKNLLGEPRDVRQINGSSSRPGEASLLELPDAQRASNDAMQTYNDARADFARSLYLLDSASGRGVNP
jgi:hypothetical protein